MTTIQYRIAHDCDQTQSELSADDLDYRCFLGDVSVLLGRDTIDASWGWVPIAHFATMLLLATRDLIQGAERAEVSFTENDAVIYLEREDSSVLVSATFTPVAGRTALQEWREGVTRFATSFFDEIIQRHTSLLNNKVIAERLRLIAEVRGGSAS